MKYEVTKKYIR